MYFATAMNENICHREFGPKRLVGAGGKSTETPSLVGQVRGILAGISIVWR